MGQCQSGSNDDGTEKVKHEGWKDLKEKPRGCTDVICIIFLCTAWFCMTIVGLIALGAIHDDNLPTGNPYRLTNAIDYQGNICGYSAGVKNKINGYYLPDFSVVCVSDCPNVDNVNKFICYYDLQAAVDANPALGYKYMGENKCMYQVKTKTFINRCVPDTDTTAAAQDAAAASGDDKTPPTYQSSNAEKGWFNTFLEDLMVLRGYIFGMGIGLAAGVAFLYLYILRIPGFLFFVLWGAIISIQILLIVGSWLLWSTANRFSADGDHSDAEVTAIRVFAYFGMIVSVIYFCLVVVLRKRVNLAIAVVKQAARAMASMPTIILLPVIQAIGIAIFLVPWMFYVLYLASSGEVTIETGTYMNTSGDTVPYTYRTFTYSTHTKYAFLYMLFCWFWTSEFIIAFGQLVISLCFSAWYFTREKASVGMGTVRWAFKTTSIYHLGTAAFGSLIIAIIKTIRAVIAYIQKQAKKHHNKVLEYIMCMLQCCMWCLEKIMKFINKHAYIITAIYGYTFCKSARTAFFLLLRNILRVAAVNMVASFLLFIGKLFVPIFTTFICYLSLAYAYDSTNITGIMSPLVFCFMLSYWVGTMFLEIFGMGIETILFCFIADEEWFEPVDRFADAELMTTIQKTAQEHAAQKAGAKVGVEPTPVASEKGLVKAEPAEGATVF